MKRKGNLYTQVCSMENLQQAARNAMKGKMYQTGVREYLKDPEGNIQLIHQLLMTKTYQVSPYKVFTIFEPKRREIYRLPFIDRVVQHAIVIVLEPIWVAMFTADTYSCIKGRGVHSAGDKIRKALKDENGTRFCLKLDVAKFYPSVDHVIMKKIIRLKIKDRDLLELLDKIIDSAAGLPIGNYLSQFLANLYLTYFDHWLKEVMRVRYYFRYCDDLVIFSDNKPYLHQLLADIWLYLEIELYLMVKGNYQVFPVVARGTDFLGYVFFHTHTRLRPSIKRNFARAVARKKGKASLAAYYGWAVHANCKNLLKKLRYETNEKIQRPGYNCSGSGIRRRQDCSRQGNKQGDNYQRLPGS